MLGNSKIKKRKQRTYAVTMPVISKTVKKPDGTNVKGVDVITHCLIVGLVAKYLIETQPQWLIDMLFPKGSAWVASTHDTGKSAPDFQIMIHQALTHFNISKYPELECGNAERARRKETGFHAKVSQVFIQEQLKNKSGFIPMMLGRHHGFKPNPIMCTDASYGGTPWKNKRKEIYKELKRYFKCDYAIPEIKTFLHANVISGLITVADWIGSGGDFAVLELEHKLTHKDLDDMAKAAVKGAGFHHVRVKPNLSFKDIFKFDPYPIQQDLIDKIKGAGVYILEAAMGKGKTEAALYAAYKLISEGKAKGIYFALPTQLTSDRIHDRVNEFLSVVSDPYDNDEYVKLLHSEAWLKKSVFGEDADAGGSWFDATKRGMLAPYAVGTIDQALMAVMNIRYGFVRTYALAGKVVILDEVHSYDTFTGTIMNELVNSLYQIGCTVIVLSATLTSKQKYSMLGRSKTTKSGRAYPLITAMPAGTCSITEYTPEADDNASVSVKRINYEAQILNDAIAKAMNGEQVLWIENTVAEAQNIFNYIKSNINSDNVECGLIHSRFLKYERQSNESEWVSVYGKDGGDKRYIKGRILVGTQVLEQSIDIDADFLVTRICPTDMLLQRIGRLWRHRVFDKMRPASAKREVVIITPTYEYALTHDYVFGTSAIVYSEYVLYRTLQVWENVQTLSLPKDIRPLLEKTYKERKERGDLKKLKAVLGDKKQKLRQFAMVGLSTEVTTLPESKAQTRYSELNTVSVLIVKALIKSAGGYSIVFKNGDNIFVPEKFDTFKTKRLVAYKLLQNVVKVAEKNAPITDQRLSWLKEYIYWGDEDADECLFRVALLRQDNSLTLVGGECANSNYMLSYSSDIGYRYDKII